MNYLLICDRQQSVLATKETVRSYSAYGALSAVTGPRLAYCGQLPDPLKGIYHLGNGHRCFDPALMRFLSPDTLSPFGAGGINAYAYCQGEPINFQDNSGRMGVPSALQTVYVAWKGGMLKKHVSSFSDMRKNGASGWQQSVVVAAIALDGVDMAVKVAKDYFGLSLHSNEDMMTTVDPLFSYLRAADVSVSLVSGAVDYIAHGMSRSYGQRNAAEGGRLESVAVDREIANVELLRRGEDAV